MIMFLSSLPAAVEAIETVQPDIYCKGTEYENPQVDVTGNFHDDIKTVEDVGGESCLHRICSLQFV